jgi:hypothetical protein
MSLWGNKNIANNAPKWRNIATANVRGSAVYGNSTPNAFVNNVTISLFGTPGHTLANTTGQATAAGWVMETVGAGPVSGYTITAGGTGYSNADTVTVSNGSINAHGVVTTNSTGGITSIKTGNTAGSGFYTPAKSVVTLTTSTGTGANVGVTLGGRAGRHQYETLVAMSSITSNSSGALPI